MPKLYETDCFAWTKNTAAALRDGRVCDVDLVDVAEEIEDLGKSERRAFEIALSQLFLHKLKWDLQPNLRGRSDGGNRIGCIHVSHAVPLRCHRNPAGPVGARNRPPKTRAVFVTISVNVSITDVFHPPGHWPVLRPAG
jgi:hypothetical protein